MMMMTTEARITVVGAGNWLISHDRVGPRVLELLDGRYGPEVELCPTGTGGLAILDHLHGQDLLLVVDACTLGGAPGELRVVEDPDLEQAPAGGAGLSVHQIGPLEALVVAHRLFPDTMPRHIGLVMVETQGITDDVLERACEGAVGYINEQISRVLVPTERGDARPLHA